MRMKEASKWPPLHESTRASGNFKGCSHIKLACRSERKFQGSGSNSLLHLKRSSTA